MSIEFGKSRSDCSSAQLDLLLAFMEETREVPGDIVEIGSWKCGASIMMASANKQKKVYAFDLFGGLPYGKEKGFENFGNTSWTEIQVSTRPFSNLKLIRGLHEDTVPKFAETPLSLVYMDSDHYSSHKVALKHFVPMLSSGGMIVFHDWTFPEVQQAIAELDASLFDMAGGVAMLNMGVLRKR